MVVITTMKIMIIMMIRIKFVMVILMETDDDGDYQSS